LVSVEKCIQTSIELLIEDEEYVGRNSLTHPKTPKIANCSELILNETERHDELQEVINISNLLNNGSIEEHIIQTHKIHP
jgi:hypothetical protein